MGDILNTLTKAEIEQLRLQALERKSKPKEKACLFCGTVKLMRADQKFCSSRCRVKAHNEQAVLLYEKLLQERSEWLVERQELIREVAALRSEIKELKGE